MASNAFSKSMNTARVDNSLSRDDEIFSVISNNAVTVNLFCLRPYWLSLMSSFFSRKLYNLLSCDFHNNLLLTL